MRSPVNKNYSVSFSFGNYSRHAKYSKNIVEMLFNDTGFSIIMIPNFISVETPFPPIDVDIYRKEVSINPSLKRKIIGFQENQIILFEDDNRKEKFIKSYFNKSNDEVDFKFIYFLDSLEYKELRLGLLKSFRYLDKDRISNPYRRNELIVNQSFKMIDDILQINIKDLPKRVQYSLEYDDNKENEEH